MHNVMNNLLTLSVFLLFVAAKIFEQVEYQWAMLLACALYGISVAIAFFGIVSNILVLFGG